MKRNLRKAIFGLLGFFILFGTLSCNNIISPKETTQVSFSLDASFLQSNQQKNVTGKNIRSLETDGYQVSILLFQVQVHQSFLAGLQAHEFPYTQAYLISFSLEEA